jgi:undecaprenol kinase
MKADTPNDPDDFPNKNWRDKFAVSFRGVLEGIKSPRGPSGPNSFMVHLPCAIIVIAAGLLLQLSWNSISVLLLCIGLVLVAELINSSIERLAKSITDQPNEHVRAALDISSGAVLMASLIAVAAGAAVFAPRLWQLMGF